MKKYGLILILLCLLTSCAGDEGFVEEVIGVQDCAVSFTPAFVAVATKTDPSSFLVKDTPVGISAYLAPLSGSEATDYSSSLLFKVTDDVGTLSPVADAMVLTGGVRYNFYAYSPAIGFDADSKKTITIPQGVDFKIAQVATTTVKNTKIVLPVMLRKCSLVQFIIKCLSDNKVVNDVRLGDGGLTMSGLTHSPVSYTLGDGDIKLDGVALDASTAIPSNTFTTQVVGREYLGAAVLLPKVSSEFLLNVSLIVINRPMELKATIPAIAFAPGRQYLYTVEISDDLIKVCLVLDWNSAASGSALGAPNAKIEVGSWGFTYTTETTAGSSNTSVIVSPWCANPAWTALLGASNSMGSVVGWNPDVVSSTFGGGSNTTTAITPWVNSSSTAAAGDINSGANVGTWTGNNTSASVGAATSFTTVTPWGTSGSSNSAGNANGGVVANGWSGATTTTTGGSSNANIIVTGWGVKSIAYVAGAINSGANVGIWNSNNTSASVGAATSTVINTPWGTSNANHSAGASNGSSVVNGWNTTVTGTTTMGI